MIFTIIIFNSIHVDRSVASITLRDPSTLQRLSPVTIIQAGTDPCTWMQ